MDDPILQKKESKIGKECKNVLKQVKGLSIAYWAMATMKFLHTGVIKVYDSRQVKSMTVIYGVTSTEAKTTQVYESAMCAATLLIMAFLSYFVKKIQYFAWFSNIGAAAAMLIEALGGANRLYG